MEPVIVQYSFTLWTFKKRGLLHCETVGERRMIYSLEPVLHVWYLLSDGLYEVVVAGDLRRYDGETVPLVPFQDTQHGRRLVLQRGREL